MDAQYFERMSAVIMYRKCVDCGSRKTEELNMNEYVCSECGRTWDRTEAFEAAYREINAVKISYGGFHGGFNEIEIDLKTGGVRLGSTRSRVEKTVATLGDNEVKELMDVLREVDILNWKRSYDNPFVLEGTQWEIALKRKAGELIRSGNNGFPDSWDALCNEIGKIAQVSLPESR
ncbi:hypothetical protein WN59_08495 [Salinicoccus sediminis]|uniref:Uncharacterized protein n=1 Tax=Salinicoccus sediminis TaxID=1432562 RepID=A0A0M2SKV2_9STAP|nr:hypothetical protein [Salinicoccus sediminis]KKK34301.1 hypothetical protein WN59_08495 [Salinicoccus sediminis]